MNWTMLIIALIIIDIFLPFVFNLLNIPQQNYLNYIIWINALIIMYIILPKTTNNIFA